MSACVYGRIGWGVNHPSVNYLNEDYLNVSYLSVNRQKKNDLSGNRLNKNGCENVMNLVVCPLREKIYERWIVEGLPEAVKSEDSFL